MRQSIAMSLLFLGYIFLLEKKYLKCVFCAVAAMLFRTSSILGIAVYALYKFLYSNNTFSENVQKKEWIKTSVILLIATTSIIFIKPLTKIFEIDDVGNYSGYFSGNLKFQFIQIIVRLPIYIFIAMSIKKLKFEVTDNSDFKIRKVDIKDNAARVYIDKNIVQINTHSSVT